MRSDRKMLLVGDSHVVGLAKHFKNLAESAGWTFISYSNVGKSTAWFARQSVVEQLVKQHAPHVVVIVLGTNDEGAQHNAANYLKNAEEVISQAGRAKVLWISSPTIPRSEIEDSGAAKRNEILMQNLKVSTADGRALTADLNALRTPDGVHFTVQGSKVWAERIFAKTRPLLDSEAVLFSWKRFVVGAALAVAITASALYWARLRGA